MSNTYHHRGQKHRHNGHDYGGKYKCNRMYGQSYGSYGREMAHTEMRVKTKQIIATELGHVILDDWDDI